MVYKVTELNDYIDNTNQGLKGRIGDDKSDITIIIDDKDFYPTVADIKQLVKFLNRVIKEAS